jgi:hypothetical protein
MVTGGDYGYGRKKIPKMVGEFGLENHEMLPKSRLP